MSTWRLWLRALRPLIWGAAIGFALTWLLGGMPLPAQLWATLIFCLVAISYCFWALWDLRRDQRRFEEQMREFDKMMEQE